MYDFLSVTRAVRNTNMQNQNPFIKVDIGQKDLIKDYKVVDEIKRALRAFDACNFPGDISDRISVCMNMAYDSLIKKREELGEYVRKEFDSAGSFVGYYKNFTNNHYIDFKA